MVLSQNTKGAITHYTHDALDRLTQVRGAVEECFSHDMADNLFSQFAKNPHHR